MNQNCIAIVQVRSVKLVVLELLKEINPFILDVDMLTMISVLLVRIHLYVFLVFKNKLNSSIITSIH